MNCCESCKWYGYTPNILGGEKWCLLAEKDLMSHCLNEACKLFKAKVTVKEEL